MADTIQLQAIQQLHSETASAKPSADVVEVGQLWINLADKTIGSKKSDGTIVTYGQLTEEERDTLLSGGGAYIPKQGVVEGITVSSLGSQADGDIVINDDSPVTITKTLTGAGVTITANKTTGCKATQVVLTKPSNVTCSITWAGVDSWLSTEAEPVFGESSEAQELCVAIFTTPTHVAVNVIYNTENPSELDLSGVSWGDISGTLTDQTDLSNALNAKADTTALNAKAPLANPAFTGTATVNGNTVATVDQIPDTSNLATKAELASYATSETVEAEFASYDKNIKAHIESELGAYLPTTGGTITGALSVQTPTQDAHAATKAYVDSAVSAVYKYKGSVAKQSALPSAGQTVGDVYNVEDTGDNFAWDGAKWDKLAGTVDLSGYLTIATAASTYQPKGDYATNTDLASKADSSTLANYLPVAGGIVTGNLTVNGTLTGTLTGSATSATQDAAGNVITTTYATKGELANKADTSALSAYAPLANPAFTGTATLGGQNIATVNQIPDITSYVKYAGDAEHNEVLLDLSESNNPEGNKNLRIQVMTGTGEASEAIECAPITNPSFQENAYIAGNAIATESYADGVASTKIALSGSRGTLAGYENTSVTASALTVTQNSPDSHQVTAAVQITVNDGSGNTAWVKKISIKNTGVSISLGSAWSWVGGSQPTVTAPSLLVLSWDNDCGLAILNTTG